MMRFLLDTDHVSLHERGHPPLREWLETVSPGLIAISVVTVEEALRGRLAILARPSAGEVRQRAYAKLMETVRFFASIQVVLFDGPCEQQYQALRAQRIRVRNARSADCGHCPGTRFHAGDTKPSRLRPGAGSTDRGLVVERGVLEG